VVLALILAAITIPIHALVLRPAPEVRTEKRAASASAADALRSAPFWLLSAAFFLATFTGIAMTVLALRLGTAATITGLVVLGMGNGMTTLARATLIADRHGAGSYGTIAGVVAFFTTGARAGEPVGAAVYAATVGYATLLWTLAACAVVAAVLAFRAETL